MLHEKAPIQGRISRILYAKSHQKSHVQTERKSRGTLQAKRNFVAIVIDLSSTDDGVDHSVSSDPALARSGHQSSPPWEPTLSHSVCSAPSLRPSPLHSLGQDIGQSCHESLLTHLVCNAPAPAPHPTVVDLPSTDDGIDHSDKWWVKWEFVLCKNVEHLSMWQSNCLWWNFISFFSHYSISFEKTRKSFLIKPQYEEFRVEPHYCGHHWDITADTQLTQNHTNITTHCERPFLEIPNWTRALGCLFEQYKLPCYATHSECQIEQDVVSAILTLQLQQILV